MTPQVLSASDTRRDLNSTLAGFRQDGIAAEPMIFGSHRKPEAAVIPYELLERIAPILEDVVLAEAARQSITDPRVPLEGDDVIRAVGLDPADAFENADLIPRRESSTPS